MAASQERIENFSIPSILFYHYLNMQLTVKERFPGQVTENVLQVSGSPQAEAS